MSAVNRRASLQLVTVVFLGFACALALGGCGARSHPEAGNGETHFLFLHGCATDSQCSSGLRCVCGACTRDCKAAASCSELAPGAACEAVSSSDDRCAGDHGAHVCVLPCHGNEECADFGASECRDGACTAPASGKNPLDGGPDATDGGCTAGRAPYYDRAGCNGTVAPVCAGPDFDACLSQVCGCDGQTLSGCGFYEKPWSHVGACTDVGQGDGR